MVNIKEVSFSGAVPGDVNRSPALSSTVWVGPQCENCLCVAGCHRVPGSGFLISPLFVLRPGDLASVGCIGL